MKRRLVAATVLAAVAMAVSAVGAGGRAVPPPRSFFGIDPQTVLTDSDIQYLRAGRIGAIRVPLMWNMVQPSPGGGYDWSGMDEKLNRCPR